MFFFSIWANVQVTRGTVIEQSSSYEGIACYKQKAYYFPEKISGANTYIKMVQEKKYNVLYMTWYYAEHLNEVENVLIPVSATGGQGIDIITLCVSTST